MKKEELTDQMLWESVRQGNEKAFAELFNRHWSKLFTTAFTTVNDRERCSSMVHDIFLDLWMKRDRLEIRSVVHYLTAAARYQVYRQLKRSRVPDLQLNDRPETLRHVQVENEGAERICQSELEETVYYHLGKLPKRCREIFLLSRKEYLSNEEIASRLGISKRTVENQLTHALHYLRYSLKELSVILILLFW